MDSGYKCWIIILEGSYAIKQVDLVDQTTFFVDCQWKVLLLHEVGGLSFSYPDVLDLAVQLVMSCWSTSGRVRARWPRWQKFALNDLAKIDFCDVSSAEGASSHEQALFRRKAFSNRLASLHYRNVAWVFQEIPRFHQPTSLLNFLHHGFSALIWSSCFLGTSQQ